MGSGDKSSAEKVLRREESADVRRRPSSGLDDARATEEEVESTQANSVDQGPSPCSGEQPEGKGQHEPVAHVHSSSQTKARMQDRTRRPGRWCVQSRAKGAVQTPI